MLSQQIIRKTPFYTFSHKIDLIIDTQKTHEELGTSFVRYFPLSDLLSQVKLIIFQYVLKPSSGDPYNKFIGQLI